MRKRWRWALAAVLCAAFAAGFLAHRPRLTRAHFDRIQLGMARGEVERLLGGPPDDVLKEGYSRGRECDRAIWQTSNATPDGARVVTAEIVVMFDQHERVQWKLSSLPPEPSESAGEWARRLWREWFP